MSDLDALTLRVTALEEVKDKNTEDLAVAKAELDTFYLMWAGAAASGHYSSLRARAHSSPTPNAQARSSS
jgi:hypothetical protein